MKNRRGTIVRQTSVDTCLEAKCKLFGVPLVEALEVRNTTLEIPHVVEQTIVEIERRGGSEIISRTMTDLINIRFV